MRSGGLKIAKRQGKNNRLLGCSGKLKMEEEKAANSPVFQFNFGDITLRCEF